MYLNVLLLQRLLGCLADWASKRNLAGMRYDMLEIDPLLAVEPSSSSHENPSGHTLLK